MEDVPTDPKVESLTKDDGDDFYENIEAPKFVDFTVPDIPYPDDSSWFCVRIGCDQNHEQVDPAALDRSFFLRVMAARSPNLKLRKALSRQAPGAIAKCPHSAPAKSAKDRISRLNVIASIAQKTRDNKVKVSLISKLNSTPNNGKAKKSSLLEKAMTTPRHKKCPPNPELFRSVRNPKVGPTVPKKSTTAAKALVFHTPKKPEKTTSSKYPNIPTPDIRSEMKKLATDSQANNVSSNLCKSSKSAARDLNHSRPSASPVKSQLSASKHHQKQDKVSSISRCKGREVPSKYLKIGKSNLQKYNGPRPQRAGDDSSDMEIEGKSRNGSLEVCTVSNGCEGIFKDANSSKLGVTDATEKLFPSSEQSSTKKSSFSNSEKDSEDDPHAQTSYRAEDEETEAIRCSNKETEAIKCPLDVCAISNRCEGILKNANTSKLGVTDVTKEPFPSPEQPSTKESAFSNSEKDSEDVSHAQISDRVEDDEAEAIECSLGVCTASNGCEGILDANSSKSRVTDATEESFPSCTNSKSEQSSNKESSFSNSEKDFEDDPLVKTSDRAEDDETEAIECSDKENATGVSCDFSIRENSLVKTTDRAEDDETEAIDCSDKENSTGVASDSSIRENSPSNSENLQEKDLTVQMSSIVGELETVESAKKKLKEINKTSRSVAEAAEPIEIANKENASTLDENRYANVQNHDSKNKVNHHKAHQNLRKVNTFKASNGSSAATMSGALGGKYQKAKPTNPKPFRLRTDERGILKEANLERRLQCASPSKETALVSKLSSAKMKKKQQNQNEIQNGMVHGRFRSGCNTKESSLIESDEAVQKPYLRCVRPAYPKPARSDDSRTSVRTLQRHKQRVRHIGHLKPARSDDSRTVTRTPQRQKLQDSKERVAKEMQCRIPKSPSLGQQLVRPQRTVTLLGHLPVIKEAPHETPVESGTTNTPGRSSSRGKHLPVIEEAPHETPIGNGTINTPGRSSSRGKRPLTVPKEPIFHRIHVPKSCTKIPGEAISSP